MQDVSEVPRRWQAGQSARRIAREMGVDRKTVGRYIDEAKTGGVVADMAVTEEVARAVGKGVQTRPLPPPSQQWRLLAQRRDQISAWLECERPLRLVGVHELALNDGGRSPKHGGQPESVEEITRRARAQALEARTIGRRRRTTPSTSSTSMWRKALSSRASRVTAARATI